MQMYHDSRSLDCRAPFGALRCGDILRLRLYCEGACGAVSVVFTDGEGARSHAMAALDGGAYELRLPMPSSPCLCWYYFMAADADGTPVYYGNAADGLGGAGQVYTHIPPAFQVTVYARDYMPPAFLHEGIMYQIFPDRFFRDRPIRRTREDIYLHDAWQEPPLALYDPRNGDTHSSDFFGGTLSGVTEKLDYLASLHVTVLYLNPIFLARSNHRYDTGDYTQIDPMLGSEEDLRTLCREAEKRGMHVLLDGVFSHTGDDSLYFNRYGRYPALGAYQSPASPYASWFIFKRFPDDYKCWWDVVTLPEVNKNAPSYRAFILGEDGVARRWVRCGTSGWRLDVADELPMSFLRALRQSVKAENPGAALLGEVWEDASHKIAYEQMRCYCLGDTLDSVMNYPLRAAAIDFVTGKSDAYTLARQIESLRENYPMPFFYSLMNLMGSHDRPRLLNVLCGETWESVDPLERGSCRLSPDQRALAVRRLREMWKLYAAMPGMPSLYYGDEAGLEGAADPFCRGTFPWGAEDAEILSITRAALLLRAARSVLRRGAFSITAIDRDSVRIRRFSHSGFDVFGQPLEDADYEVVIHAIRA